MASGIGANLRAKVVRLNFPSNAETRENEVGGDIGEVVYPYRYEPKLVVWNCELEFSAAYFYRGLFSGITSEYHPNIFQESHQNTPIAINQNPIPEIQISNFIRHINSASRFPNAHQMLNQQFDLVFMNLNLVVILYQCEYPNVSPFKCEFWYHYVQLKAIMDDRFWYNKRWIANIVEFGQSVFDVYVS